MKQSEELIEYAWTLSVDDLKHFLQELKENCQTQLANQIEKEVLKEKIGA